MLTSVEGIDKLADADLIAQVDAIDRNVAYTHAPLTFARALFPHHFHLPSASIHTRMVAILFGLNGHTDGASGTARVEESRG